MKAVFDLIGTRCGVVGGWDSPRTLHTLHATLKELFSGS